MKKQPDYIGFIIIILLFFGTLMTQVRLIEVKDLLTKSSTVPKIEIRDTVEFKKLCDQFMAQWSADGYAFYILQPKGINKTHKEKAVHSDLYDYLPIRTKIEESSYVQFLQQKQYEVISTNHQLDLLKLNRLNEGSKVIVIPIYEHNIVVGELLLFYEKTNKLNTKSIQSIISEAQVLGELLN